jgi:hypothetical protein
MSKYDIHKWKDEELNDMLMERWGYKRKVIKEAAKPDYIDIDKDGDKDEPMKQAAKDAKSKKGDEGEDDEEEVNERRRTADRTQGRPVGPGRTKVSEGDDMEDMGAPGGIPHVGAGDVEGMANAAIAAIVQLADQAGVKLNVTSGDDAIPDDMDDMDMEDDAGAEAGEEELLSPEDL